VVLLAQIGISSAIPIALMLWAIYFYCEHMTTGDRSNYSPEQTNSTFGFLKRLPHVSGQSPEQEIHAISTKTDLDFWMKACL